MLPKGSMGYVEPGSVPPIGGASEACQPSDAFPFCAELLLAIPKLPMSFT